MRDNISLTGDIQVLNIEKKNNQQIVTIAQANEPGAGSVKLFFTEEPYTLRKWQVKDAAGLTTEVALANMQRDVELKSKLFAYFAPKKDGNNFNE